MPGELEIEKAESNHYWGLSLTAWFQIVTIAVLMCALFRFNLARLWGKTNPINGQDSNWQHSIFVPLIGIYYLYIHRDELLKARARLAWSGLPILLLGILLFLYGIYPGQNDYIKDFGMVVTLFGVVAFLCGWQVMKIAWFPIAFLIVALPWPELVYSKFAWPLQQLAASAAVGTLRLFGVESNNFGTKIAIFSPKPGEPPRILNVAEACAGLRSLMTFVMVAGTVAFLSTRPMWERMVMTLSAIPIAIFCNVVRVSGQGLLDHYWSPEVSQGFAHQFVGLIMLIPGFFLILLIGWVLDKMFIEEVDAGKLKLAGGAPVHTSRKDPAVAAGAKMQSSKAGAAVQAQVSAALAAERIGHAAQKLASPAINADVREAAGAPAAPKVAAPPATLKPPTKPVAPVAGTPSASATQSGGLLPSPVKPRSSGPAVTQSTGLKPSTLKPAIQPAGPIKAAPAAQSGLKPSTPKARASVQAPGLKPSQAPQKFNSASNPAAPLAEPGRPLGTPSQTPARRMPGGLKPGAPKPGGASQTDGSQSNGSR